MHLCAALHAGEWLAVSRRTHYYHCCHCGAHKCCRRPAKALSPLKIAADVVLGLMCSAFALLFVLLSLCMYVCCMLESLPRCRQCWR
jgi:hypothetical protein